MTQEHIKKHLINKGVENLKEFGYPEVTPENILSDKIYSKFFKSMLKDNLGNNEQIDKAIDSLLLEIKN